MIKLSIIIPVYNAENEIERCIESIVRQNYSNYEIICINDGSRDKSLEKLKKLEKKYNQIKVYDQKNCGVSVTRNNGIKYAKGQYIMFIDNDDYIDNNNFLTSYINLAEKNNADIVIGSYVRKNLEGKIIFKQKIDVNSEWTKYVEVTPWARIFKRSFIEKNKIKFKSMPIGEDIYFNFSIYSKKPIISYLNNYDYVWFYNNKSVSNTKQRGFNENINVISFLEDLLKVVNINDKMVQYFIYRYVVWYLLFSGKTATKDEFIKESNKLYKFLTDNKLNKPISSLSFSLKGEGIRNRVAVLVFKFLFKFKLQGLFASVYCKGCES